MLPIGQDQRHRLYYPASTPWPESIGGCFATNVIRPVHIGIDLPAICAAKQPAFDTLASIVLAMADRLVVEERALGGVSLLTHQHADTDQFCLVGQHRDEAGVRNAHEGLV